MSGKFELKQAKNGTYMFNLKATNGQIILTGEMYKEKSEAENAIAATRENAARDASFETRTNSRGEPYFVLNAADGTKLGHSEYYSSKTAMDNGIASVKKNAPDAKVEDTTA